MINWKAKNIYLRAVEPQDLDWIFRWENAPEQAEISNRHSPFSRAVIERYIAEAHRDIFELGQLRLMIIESASDRPVGHTDLFELDAFHKRVGLGLLLEPAARGRGYAAETLALMESYVFEHLDLHQLYCQVLIDNTDSLKLFKRRGFKECGTRRDWVRRGNEFVDEVMMQLLKDDWRRAV